MIKFICSDFIFIAMKKLTQDIISWTKDFFDRLNVPKAVIGISGGKDSTVVAGILVEALGKENVIGVTLPNGNQSDINDSYAVIDHLGIKHIEVNINNAVEDLALRIPGFLNSDVARTNLPPRIRMSVLYGIAQSIGGLVVNTSNLSEDAVGWATLWGDTCGSLGPIAKLTTTEVKEIGIDLGLPEYLVYKTPTDGLQPETDEDKLGFTYDEVNDLIRNGIKGPNYEKIIKKYKANKFKTDIIQMPSFDPNYRNYLKETY